MVTNDLVERRIRDGRTFINTLDRHGFVVMVAFWLRASEESDWLLHVASPKADEQRLADGYREVYGILQTIQGTTVSASDVKLIGESNPLATEMLNLGRRYPETFVHPSILRQLGSISVTGAYIYGPAETLRQVFTVRYIRQGDTDHWQARAERGALLRGARAKGPVAYTSVRREGDAESDERFALVSVFLELDPRCDDPDLIVAPGFQQALAHQAMSAADEMFKPHHPEAVIEHSAEF